MANLLPVTHGDLDHSECVLRINRHSGTPVLCGRESAQEWQGSSSELVTIGPGEEVELAGLSTRGFPARHGPEVSLLGHPFGLKHCFVGVGTVGLLFGLEERRLLNLGDTVSLEAWDGLRTDVLMIPMGGLMTMDVESALEAIAAIEPEAVIPVRLNLDFLLYR